MAARYFRLTLLLTLTLLLVSGAVEATLGYQQAHQQLERLQSAQALGVAEEISQYLKTIERSLVAVQQLPWGAPSFGLVQRREELHRLMALNPALLQLVDIDAAGYEQLQVSRVDLDRTESAPSAGPRQEDGYGAARFDSSGAPVVAWAAPRRENPSARTVATIDLRFLRDVVSGLRVPDGGKVYVVDRKGLLIAHADPTVLLRQLHVGALGPVMATQTPDPRASGLLVVAHDAPDLDGQAVVTTAVALPDTGWRVFVEQPRSVVMAPVWSAVWRTAGLVALAAALAVAASAALARRLTHPIARLRHATREMASGKLDQQLEVHTGDEIEGLAHDFNLMASRLQQSYLDLEHKVEQRTAELALRRDEAERANAAKTRFLASASHDLRQPMHAIGLLVELLRARVQAPEQQALADKTHQAVQSMEALFGSLLDISKLDAGAIRAQPQRVALQPLLDRVTATHAPLAQAKGLQWRVRPTGLATHTDPALLERIVGNLVANAVRYTAWGGVLLACRVRGDGVVLQVVDTGVGIAADQLELVFEEFVRLDEGTPGDKGLGLGLAIVRRTAQLLGIEVNVRSRPGRGSTFEVRLPLAAGDRGADPRPSSGGTPVFDGAFVLLVDDDEINLDAAASLLRSWGCLVATARHADAAVEEAARHLRNPDVVVTDLRLGSGDHGLVLIRRLRAQAASPLPALLVTADVQLPQPVDADVQLLQKPCGADTLRDALLRALTPVGAPSGLGA